MRTPFDLQDALCAEIGRLFSGFPLKDMKGNYTPLKVYPQDLPETETDDEDSTEPTPYCIVKLVDGTAGGNREIPVSKNHRRNTRPRSAFSVCPGVLRFL